MLLQHKCYFDLQTGDLSIARACCGTFFNIPPSEVLLSNWLAMSWFIQRYKFHEVSVSNSMLTQQCVSKLGIPLSHIFLSPNLNTLALQPLINTVTSRRVSSATLPSLLILFLPFSPTPPDLQNQHRWHRLLILGTAIRTQPDSESMGSKANDSISSSISSDPEIPHLTCSPDRDWQIVHLIFGPLDPASREMPSTSSEEAKHLHCSLLAARYSAHWGIAMIS